MKKWKNCEMNNIAKFLTKKISNQSKRLLSSWQRWSYGHLNYHKNMTSKVAFMVINLVTNYILKNNYKQVDNL